MIIKQIYLETICYTMTNPINNPTIGEKLIFCQYKRYNGMVDIIG